MTLNDKLIENIDNKFKKFAKWVFPLKAVVINVRDPKSYLKQTKTAKNIGYSDLRSANLSSVGYVHFQLKETTIPKEAEHVNGGRCLEVACGISFCDPEDYFKDYNPTRGKQIAKDYTRFKNGKVYDNDKEIPTKQVSVDCEYSFINYEKKLGNWIFRNDNVLLANPHGYMPDFREFGDMFHRVYDKIIVTYNFSMRESQLLTREYIGTGDGFEYIPHDNAAFIWQVKYYLNNLIGRYISTKYKDTALAYKQDMIALSNKMEACIVKTSQIKIKNNTVIIPLEVCVEKFESLTRAGRTRHSMLSADSTIIGYMAVRFENDKWYCGASYCNPEDLSRFSSKHGRKLAYARMMERFENNEPGVLPWIIDRMNFHDFSNLPNFYMYEENGKTKAIHYRSTVNENMWKYHIDVLARRTNVTQTTVDDFLVAAGITREECCCE